MAAATTTEIAEIAESYIPVGHLERIVGQFSDMVSVVFVGAAPAAEESTGFLFIAATAGRILAFL
jgi:uracil-DNA glycosylase